LANVRKGGYGASTKDFTSGFQAVEKILKRAPTEVNRNISAVMLSSLNDLRTEINHNLDKQLYKSTSGAFQKSGRKFTQFLRNGLATKTKEGKNPFSLEGLVGVFGVLYARVQEFGAIIKPKRKKFLTIPMQPKYVGQSARGFKLDAIFYKGGKSGRLIDQRGDTAYLLLKRVEIPARPFVTPAFKELKPKIDKNIKASITGALKKAQT